MGTHVSRFSLAIKQNPDKEKKEEREREREREMSGGCTNAV
jgi:hypothetical protein